MRLLGVENFPQSPTASGEERILADCDTSVLISWPAVSPVLPGLACVLLSGFVGGCVSVQRQLCGTNLTPFPALEEPRCLESDL